MNHKSTAKRPELLAWCAPHVRRASGSDVHAARPGGSAAAPDACTVFLDRDGTINREVHHLHRSEHMELLDGAARAIRHLNEAGVRVVVVTNQSTVARGLLTESGLDGIHAAMRAQLEAHGAYVDAIYACPHHPTEGVGAYRIECGCRKPRTGTLERAARDLNLDLGCAFMVGDKRSDLEAGRAAGCRTVLVRTGYGSAEETQLRTALHARSEQPTTPLADHVADNLLEAVQWILAQRP